MGTHPVLSEAEGVRWKSTNLNRSEQSQNPLYAAPVFFQSVRVTYLWLN